MSIATKIRMARNRKNLTQAQLGRLVGPGQSAISQWENSQSVPELKHRIKLAEVLEISLSEMILEAGDTASTLTDDAQAAQLVRNFLKLPPSIRTAVLLNVLALVEATDAR